ncbi:MAG: cation:proton antiporter, partial [Actinomycetota bacterium]|nr:cation:proton antiporter [Actinomycetota bacterium]
MTFTSGDVFHLLLALLLVLAATRLGGRVALSMRLPPVIGEISAGILLGPSVFGVLFPEASAAVLPETGVVADSLDAFYELGLILLMFAAGVELRVLPRREEARTAGVITIASTVIPLAAGIAAGVALDLDSLEGTAQDGTALVIVFAAALAITSIPVISRIMLDLGLMGTRFSRIVLGSAIVEDVILYGLLAIAVGIAQSGAQAVGLPAELGIDSASILGAVYYAVASIVVLVGPLVAVRLARGHDRFGWVLARLGNEAAHQLLLVFALAALCGALGVIPIFGALTAGLIVSQLHDVRISGSSVGRFSFAFFIPLYFGLLGLRIDLGEHANLMLIATFISAACVIKGSAAYLGARLAGEDRGSAGALAVALNARGGPGIVLASVSFAAGIVSEEFFVTLILL